MPRNRMIRPEFWDDEKLAQVSLEARLVFIGLWNFSDDFGVVKGNAVWIKNRLLPYDESIKNGAFKAWLDELTDKKFILPFEHNGENYYFIKNFLKHQKINRPSKETRNPEPPDQLTNNSVSPQDILMAEKKLKEVKRKEKKLSKPDNNNNYYQKPKTPEQQKRELEKWEQENEKP